MPLIAPRANSARMDRQNLEHGTPSWTELGKNKGQPIRCVVQPCSAMRDPKKHATFASRNSSKIMCFPFDPANPEATDVDEDVAISTECLARPATREALLRIDASRPNDITWHSLHSDATSRILLSEVHARVPSLRALPAKTPSA